MDMQQTLKAIDDVIAQGPFRDDWTSLSAFQTPKWYRDAKFGIFIHWGVYSVPAFGSEWYPRNMYIQGTPEYEHHIQTYGPQKEFGYKDFIPLFTAPRFDPDAWADLFKKSGARYVVPVAEHHDGFQMYQSEWSHYNAAEMGPRRDILGELNRAFAQRGLVNGASSHRIEHWFFLSHGREFDSDVKEPLVRGDLYWPSMPIEDLGDLCSEPAPSQEFMQDWLVRTCEIVDRYRPKLLYFDWWIQHQAAKPYLKKFAAYYYNRAAQWGEEVSIDYKHDAFPFGCATVDIERGLLAQPQPFFWQTDTAIARNSWCYTESNDYKSPRDILCDFVDIISKNGCMLLNVGPKADGSISDEDTAVLLEIGDWMRANAEAVYGSRCWKTFGEGPTQVAGGHFTDGCDRGYTPQDIRFTVNDGRLYAFVLRWPEDGCVRIRSLAQGTPLFHSIISHVSVLGFDTPICWEHTSEGLDLRAPQISCDKPVVFRIEIE